MFDIGFAELLIIAVISLLVIGPERLPGAIRTGAQWLNKLKRGFNDVKHEVQQELHNDAVLQDLRKTGEELQSQASNVQQDIQQVKDSVRDSVAATMPTSKQQEDSVGTDDK
jgi:sec-independent protein translocase protein TatB